MFEINKISDIIYNDVDNMFTNIAETLQKELTLSTYNNIIKEANIEYYNNNLNVSIELEDDFDTENQDIIRVLAYGGAFKKKDGTYITVPPNLALSRYLIQ